MDVKDLYIKAVGFQKENFERTYEYVTKIQDQVEIKAIEFVDKTGIIPNPVKDFYKQWVETARKSRDVLKKYADDGYQGVENFFATTS